MSKEFWLLVGAFVLGLLVFGGCASTDRQPVNYTIKTSCPDVWASRPVQSVSVQATFSR